MNKVPPKTFRGFKVTKKVRLMFSRRKDRIKGKRYVFTGYKKTMKVPFGVFRAKTATILLWLMHSQRIMLEMVERICLERSKQQKR